MLTVSMLNVKAQTVDIPVVGAQVFVEPGQTPEYIDMLYSRMEDAGMQVGRIRMFGSHVIKEDGTYDFSLYDTAFDAAARHGVKMFVTLFPPTDELNDVGGFKFPRSEKHLQEILDYTRAVVNHFKNHPALFCWVLQNEPGVGETVNTHGGLSGEKYEEFCRQHPMNRDGYLQADMRPEQFTREYTTWYLKTIAEAVAECDPVHGRHINPHQVLTTLPEYDFKALSDGIITSLGSSMHLSWHFGDFKRYQYTMAVAMISDIIHSAALGNGAWVTEMQGGPVTVSGYDVLCPSAEEMEQNMWTSFFTGMKGVLFWTLNPRKAVQEAGEWALLDFNSQPSERLDAAARVASTIREESARFDDAEPVKSAISIIYNKESLWIQHRSAGISKDTEHAGRGKQAVAQSMAAAYSALSSLGFSPQIHDIDLTELDGFDSVLLPDIVALRSDQIEKIREFAENGGTVIMTSMTGYYDENMSCNFMNEGQKEFTFTGARIKEFAVGPDNYPIGESGMANHFWKGKLETDSAEPIISDNGECIACRNKIGEGSVIWFPSMIELGAWNSDDPSAALDKLAAFYSKVLPVKGDFNKTVQNVIVRTMESEEGNMMLIINKNSRKVVLKIKSLPSSYACLYGSKSHRLFGHLILAPDSTTILGY